jgi:hypothetical protein
MSVTSNHLVRFRSTSPRKNLPPSISRKRAEANFLCSFERAFVAGHCQTKQITWRDFALQGYGIPDLITFAWSTQQNQATVLSLEALRQKLQRQQLITASTSSARWSSPRARLSSQCEVARGFFSKINRSAAPSKSSLFDGVAGVLALPKELLVGHDRLSRMMHPPMLHIRPIIGNPNHETGRLHDQVE